MADVVVLERLRALAEYVDELAFFRSKAEEFTAYQKDVMLQRAVERALQVSVEICIDIGRRLTATEGFCYAETNREVFQVLFEEDLLTDELTSTIQEMAGFRNILVHHYVEIDNALVYEFLHEHLEDFDAFAEAIQKFIQDSSK